MLDQFLQILDGEVRCNVPQLAFCTHYSWFGVVKDDCLGIEATHLFYNRFPALLSPQLLAFQVVDEHGDASNKACVTARPLQIDETGPLGFGGRMAFVASDILCYHVDLSNDSQAREIRCKLFLPPSEPTLQRSIAFDQEHRLLTIETHVPRSDQRDPDPDHELTLCLRVPDGFEPVGGVYGTPLTTDAEVVAEFYAPAEAIAGRTATFVLGIGEGPAAGQIENRMVELGEVGPADSEASSRGWLEKSLDSFSFERIEEPLRLHYAKAAYQILCNAKAPRGQIKRTAVYPCRGTYCAHYLWDACFTNLGLAQFNRQLAEDALLILCDNQEPDGKIPHFVTATFNRPGESQPPLIAWSAWRLYRQFRDLGFITKVYEPISRMVEWWFAKRDEDHDGVVEYAHRLESGWDDSPRFQKGRIAAVDLNAYLNREMRLLGRMATEMEKAGEAVEWNLRAQNHGRRMMARLFDHDDEVFFDRLVKEDRLHKVLTPASLTPLWAGVHISGELASKMIARYLINPKHFFGSRPFPVVAYSDPNYNPEKWWRGPVWPNIAWIMTEILRDFGYEQQQGEAVDRLIRMMTEHDELNELYSSATGAPLGAPGLCWGDAVFMEMARNGAVKSVYHD